MAGTGDKLMTASEIKEVTDTKLIKDFSSLTALSGTPATGDLVPIKSGNETYKIDYNALASAILGQISSNGVVNVANGGTGSNSATGALSGLIGALDTSSGFSLSDTIPVSINGTAYTITGRTLSNAVVGGGTGVTATLPIANGGTGAASASAARTALDVYSKSEVATAIAQSTAIAGYTGSNGLLVYRAGKLAQIVAFGTNQTTDSSAVIGTITESAFRPAARIWQASKVYNGSQYVDCYVEITVQGVISVKSTTGGTAAGYQGQYLQAIGLAYICNGA